MPKSRINVHEAQLENLAGLKGWTATKKGWPDFMCFNDKTGEIIAVEVKPRTAEGRLQILRKEQAICMDFLSSHGVRCFVSDGKKLELYRRDVHREAPRLKPTRTGETHYPR